MKTFLLILFIYLLIGGLCERLFVKASKYALSEEYQDKIPALMNIVAIILWPLVFGAMIKSTIDIKTGNVDPWESPTERSRELEKNIDKINDILNGTDNEDETE